MCYVSCHHCSTSRWSKYICVLCPAITVAWSRCSIICVLCSVVTVAWNRCCIICVLCSVVTVAWSRSMFCVQSSLQHRADVAFSVFLCSTDGANEVFSVFWVQSSLYHRTDVALSVFCVLLTEQMEYYLCSVFSHHSNIEQM